MASVEVRDADPAEALVFLAGLETASGVPPVDEDEQRRLAGLPPIRDPGWHWDAHLAAADGTTVAYAGIRTPGPDDERGGGAGTGCAGRIDLAFDRARPDAQRALAAMLGHVRLHAGVADDAAPCGPLEAWLRGATADDLATSASVGFHETRRLHVLGVTREAIAAATSHPRSVPEGLRLRAFDPDAPGDADAEAVVDLLRRAYPAAASAFAARFPVQRAADWFRAEDLLLLEDGAAVPVAPGRLRALHWMKRRGDGVSEVYNLAVDPSAQGQGYGALLLDAGLRHLVEVGSREVLLWVDAANTPAVALYRSRGFTERWDDVSLTG